MECMKRPAAGSLSSFFPTQRDDAAMTQDQEYLRVQRNRVAPEPLSFPATQAVLWNRTAQGESEILYLTRKRNVRLYINEKTLRLAHRHVTQSNSSLECFLVGSISVDSREDSIDVTVDRFDPGREVLISNGSSKVKRKVPTTVVPGDHIVPVTLIQGLSGADSSVTHTKEEFHKAFQVLFGRICGQEPMNLSHLLSLKVSCHVHGGDTEIIINVHCGTITMATKIQATPVAAVPIIPTALARNLSGPLRLSEVQGVPKNGYLTMDHTRKLLLLLESDPKAFSLPLLGIWVSGIFSIHHPFIWACCVRFIHSTAIQQRVLAPPNSFLLLLYSPVNNTPEFWECRQDQGESEQKMFEYYSCYENLHLEIPPGPNSSDPLCFELFPAPGGMGRSLFEQAVEMWGKEQKQLRLNQDSGHNQGITLLKQGSGEEDPSLIPRPSPSPHPQNVQFVLPDVKETSLSLSFEEHISGEHTGQDLTNQQIFPHPKLRQQQPKPQGKSKQRIQNGQENGLVMFQKEASPGFGVGKEHVKQSQSNGAPVNSPSREPLKQILVPNQTLDKVMSKKAKGSLPRPYPLQSSVVQKVPKHRGTKPRGHNIQEKTEKTMGSHSTPRSETIGRELSPKEANIMQGPDSVRDQSKSKIPGNEIVRGNPQDFEVEVRRPSPKQRTLSSLKDNKNRLEQVDQQQFLRHNDRQVMTEKKMPLPIDQVQRPFLETVFEGETPDGTLNRSMDESELERHITGTSEISQGPPGMHQFQINSGNGYSKTAGSDSPGLILDHSRMQGSHGYQRDTESKEERLAQPMPSGRKDGNKDMCDDIAGCSAKEGLDNFKDLIAKEGTTKSSDVSPQMQNKGMGKILKDLEENTYDRRHSGACMGNMQVDGMTGHSNQNCPAEEASHPDPYELLMRQEAQLRQLQEQIKLLLHHQHAKLPTPNTLLTPPRTPQFEFCHGNNRPPDHSPVSMVTACTNTGASLLLGTPVKPRGKRSAATSPIKQNEVMHSGRSLPASSTKSSQDNSKESQRHDSSVNPEELTNQMIELDDPSQTLASSLHAVDIPSFVESPSGVTSPSPLDKANRGGMGTSFTSPVLGESASILVEQRVREGETHNTDKEIFTEEERTGKQSNHVSLLQRNERQFYDNLLSQVKNILDQQVQEESDPSEKPPQESKQNADVLVPEPTREEVITATMRELEKIKNSTLGAAYVDSSKSPLSAKQWPLQRSASLSAIPDHPHINYMSFSVDETLDEVFSEADLKYLTENQLQELQQISSHRKKHGRERAVTFSVLPEGVSVLSRKGTVEKGHLQCDSSSLTAVDYTWNNLSMATKEYLGKYCLAPQKPSDSDGGNVDCNAAMKGSDETGERLGQQISVRSQGCTAPPCTPEPTKRGDSDSQILDIRRLKKLPKLF